MKLKRVIQLKMTGDDVKYIQTLLKEYGFFKDRVDGYFGQNTLVAVSNFQRAVSTKADGIVGPLTWNKLQLYGTDMPVFQKKNDKEIPYTVSFVSESGLEIYDNFLSEDEYYKKETNKNTIWLHHTAGGSRPDWTIGGWEKDFQKDEDGNPKLDSNGNALPLRVGTHFVIGRKSSSTDFPLWDGKVLRAFDERYWAYHLGISTKNSEQLNSRSIGIEICNYGPLTLGKDEKFYNYVNKIIEK